MVRKLDILEFAFVTAGLEGSLKLGNDMPRFRFMLMDVKKFKKQSRG